MCVTSLPESTQGHIVCIDEHCPTRQIVTKAAPSTRCRGLGFCGAERLWAQTECPLLAKRVWNQGPGRIRFHSVLYLFALASRLDVPTALL